jgi:hypothetical protein
VSASDVRIAEANVKESVEFSAVPGPGLLFGNWQQSPRSAANMLFLIDYSFSQAILTVGIGEITATVPAAKPGEAGAPIPHRPGELDQLPGAPANERP